MDPRLLYTFDPAVWESLRGSKPVLVHLLDGYVDAAAIGHNLRQFLLNQRNPRILAEFDVDQLHDYRSRRPLMTFDTNTWVGVRDFRLLLHVLEDANGTPFLLFHGPEPDAQWQRTARAVVGLAERLEVRRLVTSSGVPMAVPHTRPTLVTAHATDPSLATGNPAWIDRIQIPGSFSAMLEYRAGEAGLVGMGFVAHVPHYLAQTSFPQGVLAVLEKIMDATGLSFDTTSLQAEAQERIDAINEEISADADFPGVLAGLEEQYDDMESRGLSSMPSADELGAAVERFLAERDGES